MTRLEAPLGVAAAPGPLAKAALVAGGLVVIAVGLVVSVAVAAVAVVAGAVGFGWLAWKTRDLRRAVRDELAARGAGIGPGRAPGRVIEGEAASVPDERA